jgi:hypothetical protein
MRSVWAVVCLLVLETALGNAQGPAGAASTTGRTALTIYNQDFAVIRTPVELDLHAGTTDVSETNVTAQVEPDSVVLRDAAGKRPISILEQNYDGSLRVQAQMLAKFEGKTIDFAVGTGENTKIMPGKIIRAGNVPQYDLLERYGQQYFYQMTQTRQQQEPLVEMEGKLRYGLPGVPMFPSETPGLTLRPTLHWLIASEKAAKVTAELDYITRGLRWDATYNVIAPAEDASEGQRLDISGWVDVTNETGADFHDASLQLMAGDISKLVNANGGVMGGIGAGVAGMATMNGAPGVPQQITQKSFDDYHLYDLHRTATLLDHQSKQIEFLNVTGIPVKRVYVYDGFKVDAQNNQTMYYQWNQENFGNGTNRKVWIMQEFKNSDANHLGMPLPKGRMRFYRRDADGNLQFVGENTIDHTPKDESIKVYLGNAFDITGERTRTDFRSEMQARIIIESYKVVVKNAKDSAASVRVVEHLYRTANWDISKNSSPFTKADSQTMEFNVEVPAHGERKRPTPSPIRGDRGDQATNRKVLASLAKWPGYFSLTGSNDRFDGAREKRSWPQLRTGRRCRGK